MAKKKVGRSKKKRNRQNEANVAVQELYKVTDTASNESQRASDSSYVFVCGNKVLVRNLSDETLNERLDQTFISACEARRSANQLEQLEYNLAMEQRFRGLN